MTNSAAAQTTLRASVLVAVVLVDLVLVREVAP